MRVVLIDASNLVNKKHQELLESFSCIKTVKCYSDSITALDEIERLLIDEENNIPELIFLDLEMPKMDGFEFLQKYSELVHPSSENKYPSFVIISNRLSENQIVENIHKYKKNGVISCLNKPLDSVNIQALLEEHFEDLINTKQSLLFGDISIELNSFKMILPDFFEEIIADTGAMKQDLMNGDLVQLRKGVHKVKGTAASYSALQITDAARNLQELIDTNKRDELDSAFIKFEHTISLSLQYAKEHFNIA